MSLLPSATFANPSTPFYAALGGGGGGSTSNIQSPATVVPNAPGGASVLTFAGSRNVITMAGANIVEEGTSVLKFTSDPLGVSQLVAFDIPGSAVTLGVGPVALGSNVVVNTPLTIQDQTYPATGLVISGEPPFVGVTGVSRISNDLVSNGVLQLGSSVAQATTVQLQETTGGGAYGYVTIGGQSGGTGDRLKMYGGGAACSITTNDAGTTGVLNIGADDSNPSYQSLAFTHNAVAVNVPMTYSATSGPPLAAFSPTILRTGITPIGTTAIGTGALAAGVYLCYGRAVASTDAGDLAARFSSVIQIAVGGSCVGGGQVAGQTNTYILAPNGTTGLNLTLVAATTAAYQVIAFPMFLI